MKNVLILGGGGFIGTSLSNELCKKGYKVTILDSYSEQVHGADHTASYLYQNLNPKVERVVGDVLDDVLLLKLLKRNEYVVHMISETGTAQSMYRLRQYTDVNIGSVSTLMDLLVNNTTKVKKVFLASSRAVYGEGRYTNESLETIYPPIRNKVDLEEQKFDLYDQLSEEILKSHHTNEEDKINPISIYGFSKYAQEQLVKITCQTYGIDYCILRYQNVFGPGQSLLNSYTGVLNVFASRALLEKPLDIFEDGKGLRDFVYVDDAVSATIAAIENEVSSNKIYNVGTGIGTSIMDAAISISECLDQEVVCQITGNYRYGDIRHSIADTQKIEQDLDFYPKYTFKQGLYIFLEWVKSQDIRAEKSDVIHRENLRKGVLRIKK